MKRQNAKLQCCCCGGEAYGKQWYNRDKGYGLCTKCADVLTAKESPENMESYYGIDGVNYFTTGIQFAILGAELGKH